MASIKGYKVDSKTVPVSEVHFNDWNPKQKRTVEYEKVKESVKLNGQLAPIVVREIKDGYEVLDGEQRFTAIKDLGLKEVWIANLGKVKDADAKSLTIWMEQNVPFDDKLLGDLLLELKGQVELPYTDAEIELISGVFADEDETEEDEESLPEDPTIKWSLSFYKEDIAMVKQTYKTALESLTGSTEDINRAIIQTIDVEKVKAKLEEKE